MINPWKIAKIVEIAGENCENVYKILYQLKYQNPVLTFSFQRGFKMEQTELMEIFLF